MRMNKQKFLQQVCSKLEEELENEVKLSENCIEIFEGDKAIFKIDESGGVFYSVDRQFSNIVNILHSKIEHIVLIAKEYEKTHNKICR